MKSPTFALKLSVALLLSTLLNSCTREQPTGDTLQAENPKPTPNADPDRTYHITGKLNEVNTGADITYIDLKMANGVTIGLVAVGTNVEEKIKPDIGKNVDLAFKRPTIDVNVIRVTSVTQLPETK